MRKVTEQIAKAFHQGESKTVGNTSTSNGEVFLHGNKIIRKNESGEIWFTFAGWDSNVTKERLNGILGIGAYHKNRVLYIGNHEIETNRWYRFYG